MQQLLPHHIAGAIQRHQARSDRIAAQSPGVYYQSGRALVTNSGAISESVITVTFAHPFTEEPHFTFGAVMNARQQIVNGSFPTVSAVVQGWASSRGDGSPTYTGATIAVVTSGLDAQEMWVHYRFEGYALSFANLPGS